jgi:hypothetical protein
MEPTRLKESGGGEGCAGKRRELGRRRKGWTGGRADTRAGRGKGRRVGENSEAFTAWTDDRSRALPHETSLHANKIIRSLHR